MAEQKEGYCLMQYQCEKCQHLEWIWNSRDAVTPFLVGCGLEGCDGMKQHINWHYDTPLPVLPVTASRVFVSVARDDAVRLAEQKWDLFAERGQPLPDQPRDQVLADWAEYIYGDGRQPYLVTRTAYRARDGREKETTR